jgi:hypothetical protein
MTCMPSVPTIGGSTMGYVLVVGVLGGLGVLMRMDTAVDGCRQRRRRLREPLTLPSVQVAVAMARRLGHGSTS